MWGEGGLGLCLNDWSFLLETLDWSHLGSGPLCQLPIGCDQSTFRTGYLQIASFSTLVAGTPTQQRLHQGSQPWPSLHSHGNHPMIYNRYNSQMISYAEQVQLSTSQAKINILQHIRKKTHTFTTFTINVLNKHYILLPYIKSMYVAQQRHGQKISRTYIKSTLQLQHCHRIYQICFFCKVSMLQWSP